jgi:hypothetical protein
VKQQIVVNPPGLNILQYTIDHKCHTKPCFFSSLRCVATIAAMSLPMKRTVLTCIATVAAVASTDSRVVEMLQHPVYCPLLFVFVCCALSVIGHLAV